MGDSQIEISHELFEMSYKINSHKISLIGDIRIVWEILVPCVSAFIGLRFKGSPMLLEFSNAAFLVLTVVFEKVCCSFPFSFSNIKSSLMWYFATLRSILASHWNKVFSFFFMTPKVENSPRMLEADLMKSQFCFFSTNLEQVCFFQYAKWKRKQLLKYNSLTLVKKGFGSSKTRSEESMSW